MKRIFGLDLGTASIGWAVVNESTAENESNSIERVGVRSVLLSVDEKSNFEQGKSITTNADRNLKRSARRNLSRYKLRRESLLSIMKREGWINHDTLIAENGSGTTFELRRLRAQAASEKVTLEEFARVLMSINKKRGYKSNRKTDKAEDGVAIDSVGVAMLLAREGLTAGQYTLQLFDKGAKKAPDFYPSDLMTELTKIATFQRAFYPELTDEFISSLTGKNERQTWAMVASLLGAKGIKRVTKRGYEQKYEEARWRSDALTQQLDVESLTIALSKVNGAILSGSGYLGAISDRSKHLALSGKTIGQHELELLEANPHTSLKGKAYYRQDYIDEFNRIWDKQSEFHPELTTTLKEEIRDRIIFYQRPLKSKKGSIAICELEGHRLNNPANEKERKMIIGPRVCPKSSPLFQEFKMWQVINNISVSKGIGDNRRLTIEEKNIAAAELNRCDKMSATEFIKLIFPGEKGLSINFKSIEGNRTNAALLKAYISVAESYGYDIERLEAMPRATEVVRILRDYFAKVGISTEIFDFETDLSPKEYENQPSFKLWHLLYSAEDDDSKSGTEKLRKKLSEEFGFSEDGAAIMATVTFADDYGSLSTKAMRAILPHLKRGLVYSEACEAAGYNHSAQSKTKEQIESTEYLDCLEILPKGDLRNPVVEKIINQMINVVNELSCQYGRPDEIRIELARELKQSAKDREEATAAISGNQKNNERICKILAQAPFNITNPSRNDVIRYKLYEELAPLGYRTLYSDTYIPKEDLFTNKFNIEHIIPQARLFDDSFANKTIEAMDVNIKKGSATAIDFVESEYGGDGVERYKARIANLVKEGAISKSKQRKLLTKLEDIPTDFINRDLKDTQYIAKKAREILLQMAPRVVATTGSITDRLREDWQIVDVLKELNWDKYDSLGLTETYVNRDGQRISRIKDWTKRNDNRHHAMDALAIAFTRPEFIQYLNNLNARSDKSSSIYGIEHRHLYRDGKGKLRFNPPMPLDKFRAEVRRQLEAVLVSFKAKNKVVTGNTNITKSKNSVNRKRQQTPRGQLHNGTVYGKISQYRTSTVKVNARFDETMISKVASKAEREALLARLKESGGDPKKAFTGKNSLEKAPIYLDVAHSCKVPAAVKIVEFEEIYTVRKSIDPNLNIDKVIDVKIKNLLKDRLNEFGGDAKKAFSNLEENPIYLNKDKGITIKRVTIQGPTEVEPLHAKRDHNGHEIHDEQGRKIPTDYVSTSNNHHVALFLTPEGKVEEVIVSFYEATARAIAQPPMPVIDRNYRSEDGWSFLMTLKRNEYIVFPRYQTSVNEDGETVTEMTFNPREIDLLDQKNYALISPNLFRVQKLSSKYYVFRHHLETNVAEIKELRDKTWKRIQTISLMKDAVKVRVNNIGQIVDVGEY